MEAAALLQRRGELDGRVRLALLVDEEYRSLGADHYIARHPEGTACIITEPSELAVVPVHKGFQWIEVVTRGRQAHGSQWEVGVSAIAKMGPVIAALDVFDRTVLRTRTSPRLSAASLHSAVIQGGSGISTYAVECRLGVERRTLPWEVPDDVFREIVDVVQRACPDAEVTLQFQRYPMQTPEDSLLVRSLGTAIERRLGRAMELQGAAGWGDTAVFSGAGVPAVEFGCIGDGAHAQVEWVDFDSVADVATLAVDAAELIDKTA
ncbi:MAG: M20/M25/M40 family metallo-hydrolase, partial [Clostridia bacterium]